ncbi:hypothetical protein BZA05DRAFT_446719 [Tricharina praecox]|uniref:uncharacterized protein n=1 Tax=Tricharina praecox TaxID=43433 RepID=UPI002220C97E|nr:uncharacterized protein BZA05DRAFT_446719 [Tricharina praecox]KAI5848000.1 hypothetical protein BZA05DRAFT_446719 [Tricharina praecox]
MASLALTYRKQSRWKKAEGLEVQVMEIRMRVLGNEHPDTLQSMTSMASLALKYRKRGWWKEAERLLESALEASKRVLGKEHPNTLKITENLASIYISQGKIDEFVELREQNRPLNTVGFHIYGGSDVYYED